jgi:hypothetical protein
MGNKIHRKFLLLVLIIPILILLLLVTGCTPLRPQTDPRLDKKALVLANTILSLNKEITSSKGTGWVEVETDTRTDKFKIAWAASAPNRLRITFLVAGHPVETIVATGNHVTFISHTGEHNPHTTFSSDPNLKKYLHVPVKLSDLIAILLGHIPIKKFDHAWFKPGDSNFPPIILAQNWELTFQQLHLNKVGKVQRLVFLDKDNMPVYDITYIDYQAYGKSRIPATLLVKDTAGKKIHLTLTRFVPNPPIKESVFRLTESGS